MSAQIITNKTVYNEEIIKRIASYKAKGTNKFKMVLILICMLMMFGSSSLQSGYKTVGFIAIGIGLVFVPIALTLIPYLYSLFKMKRELKLLPENNRILFTTFSNTGIRCDNKITNPYNIVVGKINEIVIKNQLIIISDKTNNYTYLDINGLDTNIETFDKFISKYYKKELIYKKDKQ